VVVVPLESSQLFDLRLQQAALATELLKHIGPLLLGLGDERVVLGLTRRDKPFLHRGSFCNELVMA
jgi:hypothetical protein